MSENKSALCKIVSLVFSFFLSFFLFLFVVTMILQCTVLNQFFLRDRIRESNYYGNVIKEIEDEFISFGAASGFDEKFFGSVIETSQLEMDVSQMVSRLYSADEKSMDTEKFEGMMYKLLVSNVESREIAITPDIDSGLKYLAQNCTETYKQYITLPYIQQIAPMLLKVKNAANVGAVIFLGLFLICALIPYLINRWIHRTVRYWIYAVSGTLLMTLIVPIIVFLSGNIKKVGFSSPSLYDLTVSYLNGSFICFFSFALGILIFLVFLILVYKHLRKKLN